MANKAPKMHKCKSCGQEIANSAKHCPNCGAKQKGGALKIVLIVVGVLFVLGLIGSIAGGGSKSKKSDSSTTEATTQDAQQTEEAKKAEDAKKAEEEAQKKAEEEAKNKTSFTIGETADFNGVQITLQNAMLSPGKDTFVKPDDGKVFLGCIVEIVNNSKKDVSISSLANFEAYCDDYALNQDLIGYQCPEWDGYGQLDNKVAPGKRMAGVICYQVPAEFGKFDLSISPSFWSNKKVDFTFTRDQCH